ncbi:MAG: hypothetical protein KDA28_10275 [Phycisphaerales bacterium]|nr:hypothetical protein [Phycisphaerales bacterium]
MSDLERRLSSMHTPPLPDGAVERIEARMRHARTPWWDRRLAIWQVASIVVVSVALTWVGRGMTARPSSTSPSHVRDDVSDRAPIRASIRTTVPFRSVSFRPDPSSSTRPDIRRWASQETHP